jgi:hypothetical protein
VSRACPSVEELECLLAGELSPADEQAIERHIVDCEACRLRLEEITQFAWTLCTRNAMAATGDSDQSHRGGLLARLANSSKPVLRPIAAENAAKKQQTEFLARGSEPSNDLKSRSFRRQVVPWPLATAAVLLGVAVWLIGLSLEDARRQERAIALNAIFSKPAEIVTTDQRQLMVRTKQPIVWSVTVMQERDSLPIGVSALRVRPTDDNGLATEIITDEANSMTAALGRNLAAPAACLLALAAGFGLARYFFARPRAEPHDDTVARRVGKYTLMEKIGSGGMGTVYKARHELLRRPTAVKLLNSETTSDTAIARFEREVQLTSALTHPNTISIYDFGRTPGGIFYYAMEYLEGINLEELVRRYSPLPEARVLHILRQICASLGEAHAAGLVHRDVKPANVFLTVRGGQCDFVKVLDFGLARSAVDEREVHLTSTNTVAGSPLYLSPEAITEPERIDTRADVYGIGALGYYLLTGSPVFSGSSATDICLKHVRTTPEPPSGRTKQPVSPRLDALLLRCLAKAPDDRPHDATDLLHLLDSCTDAGCWTSTDAARWWVEHDQDCNASPANAAIDAP